MTLDELRKAETEIGLDTDTALRVEWASKLRRIVGRRCPKNKSGSSMVSDIDVLLATPEERLEAYESITKEHDTKPH